MKSEMKKQFYFPMISSVAVALLAVGCSKGNNKDSHNAPSAKYSSPPTDQQQAQQKIIDPPKNEASEIPKPVAPHDQTFAMTPPQLPPVAPPVIARTKPTVAAESATPAAKVAPAVTAPTTGPDVVNNQDLIPVHKPSKLEVLFTRYMSLPADAKVEEVDQAGARLVDEILNEPDAIPGKRWEVEQLLGKITNLNDELPQSRITALRIGLNDSAQSLANKEERRDLLTLTGMAATTAVLGGYGVLDDVIPAMSARGALRSVQRTASGIKNMTVDAAQATSAAAGRVFNIGLARQSGQRMAAWFARTAHRLTPEEQLMRDLQAFDIDPADLHDIQTNLINSQQVDISAIEPIKEFHQTNLPSLKVGAKPMPEVDGVQRAVIVFMRRPGRLSFVRRESPVYFQTQALPEQQVRNILGHLPHGKDARQFVEMATEEDIIQTRVPTDRFAESVTVVKQKTGETANALYQKLTAFNGHDAARWGLIAGSLSLGYYELAYNPPQVPNVSLEAMMVPAPVHQADNALFGDQQ